MVRKFSLFDVQMVKSLAHMGSFHPSFSDFIVHPWLVVALSEFRQGRGKDLKHFYVDWWFVPTHILVNCYNYTTRRSLFKAGSIQLEFDWFIDLKQIHSLFCEITLKLHCLLDHYLFKCAVLMHTFPANKIGKMRTKAMYLYKIAVTFLFLQMCHIIIILLLRIGAAQKRITSYIYSISWWFRIAYHL